MVDDPKKVVWILGAGFSRPLGGPLLPQLLAVSSWVQLGSRFPRDKHPNLYVEGINEALVLYHHGRNFKDGNPMRTGETNLCCGTMPKTSSIAWMQRPKRRTRRSASIWHSIRRSRFFGRMTMQRL